MSIAQDPSEANVEQVHASLNEGLETCRAVVEDYRVALEGTARRKRPMLQSSEDLPQAGESQCESG